MLFQNSRLPPSTKSGKEYRVVLNSGNSFNGFSSRIRNFIRRLSIAKKIGYGYSLAIGIAVCGTATGVILGDYYQEKAQKQLTIANQQQHLIINLKNAVGTVRSHPQQLVAVLGQPLEFNNEIAKFSGEVERVKTILSDLDYFVDANPDNLATEPREVKKLLKNYDTNLLSYTQLVQSLWQQIEPSNTSDIETFSAQQTLLNFLQEKTAITLNLRFEYLSEQLTQLEEAATTQQMRSNDEFERAKILRVQIITASMILSVAIAVVLALITSRAIARPLQAVTDVAQAVTQRGNFNLQAPVTTEDEVGLLATSLNQLVQWVGEHTKALELARQTLEQRVEERTQELQTALQNLKQAQVQLIQTEKMSSLGQLVSGIAHEINNPINFVHGNVTYAQKYAEDLVQLIELYQQEYPHPSSVIQEEIELIELDFLKSDLSKIFTSMQMGTERIQKIVLSLRNFSRLDESEVKSVDIHEGIDNTLVILNHRLKKGIEVIKQYGKLPFVSCYPAQLNQVFMNILANAIDALMAEEELLVKQIIVQTRKVCPKYIQVAIWNNGSEIPAPIKDKLFDPFFTTKPIGQGTGLGLTICYQIVEKHRGKIEVISEPEQGTEFAITLPIQREC
jgi:signal transduction histidine kinase/HAMP domain-containing protein